MSALQLGSTSRHRPIQKLSESMIKKKVLWRLCSGIVIALSALTFTPVVLTPGLHLPMLFGTPRTLWLGILIAVAIVVVTFIGGFVHPANSDPDRSRDDR